MTVDLTKLMKELTDQGKLIEAGWISLRIAAIPEGLPPRHLDSMRDAFFAGAQHLFASIMGVLDEGDDATMDDMRRMSLISAELEAFGKKLAERYYPTKGSA